MLSLVHPEQKRRLYQFFYSPETVPYSGSLGGQGGDNPDNLVNIGDYQSKFYEIQYFFQYIFLLSMVFFFNVFFYLWYDLGGPTRTTEKIDCCSNKGEGSQDSVQHYC